MSTKNKLKTILTSDYGQNFFGQPGWNDLVTYNSLQKIATGQGDDYTTVCLLDYNYFKKY